MIGLGKFREHFAGCEGQYVLIGGAACDVIFEEVGIGFRATRDLDIVLCVETLDAAFAERLWRFIEAGGYQQKEQATGEKQFYRFQRPADGNYPSMLELFARKPDAIELAKDGGLTPIPVDGEIESLSAILLDDDYYRLLMGAVRIVDGLAVADERILIPFKARAHLDLAARKAEGQKVDTRDVNKHRTDVFRLLLLLPEGEVVELPPAIKGHVAQFCEAVAADDGFEPKRLNFTADKDELLARLRTAYGT